MSTFENEPSSKWSEDQVDELLTSFFADEIPAEIRDLPADAPASMPAAQSAPRGRLSARLGALAAAAVVIVAVVVAQNDGTPGPESSDTGVAGATSPGEQTPGNLTADSLPVPKNTVSSPDEDDETIESLDDE